MRKQQRIWQKEHDEGKLIPSEMLKSSTDQPSSYIVKFTKFLVQQKFPLTGRAVDMGAGKGRNTIYLAKQGLSVYALDYIESAIEHIKATSKKEKLDKRIHAVCTPIDEPWPFADNYFDIVIDCFSSIDIETLDGRIACRNEMFRTLKQGGFALIVVVSAEDEFESELIKKYPGIEKNSSVWPGTGKFQKDYDEKELKDFYSSFKVVTLEKLQKVAHKMGKDFTATNYWMVLRKK